MSRNFGDVVKFERLYEGFPEIDDGTESDAEVFAKADMALVDEIVRLTDAFVAGARDYLRNGPEEPE